MTLGTSQRFYPRYSDQLLDTKTVHKKTSDRSYKTFSLLCGYLQNQNGLDVGLLKLLLKHETLWSSCIQNLMW